ncbi:hypothetical protein TspCOW1_15390 [Thiohalobacter sp. COW1]|uniref:ChuX/HutX family heme-like substrate-binding protein n=1 Tax=Thiohalobacter sp. COW1 TaxID=2795687 RepID=UPI0019161C68|nr:ChuX/HutX family heme-like substrate-binding protein [Thiohalobacter sp. COW1]BCO31436.1 hypothetical protein TspCOW1_15390 [Thiohalobacter sp. COW1]
MNQQVMLDGIRPMISLREALAHQFTTHPDRSLAAIAARLGVSEVQLLTAACGRHVTRLACNRHELLSDLACLGPVCVITGNRQAEQEQVLEYRLLRLSGDRGLLLAGDYELDLDFANWHYGFAITRPVRRGVEHSLHFFDAHGRCNHRIRLTSTSDAYAYRMFVAAYRSTDQSPELLLPRGPSTAGDQPALSAGRAGGCHRCIPVAQLSELLHSLVDVDLCISFTVANAGTVHTWRGMVDAVRCEDGRLMLQAADYCLVLEQAQIAGARLPCQGSTLELYGADGETLATLGGPLGRYPSQLDVWQRLLAALPVDPPAPSGCQSHY